MSGKQQASSTATDRAALRQGASGRDGKHFLDDERRRVRTSPRATSSAVIALGVRMFWLGFVGAAVGTVAMGLAPVLAGDALAGLVLVLAVISLTADVIRIGHALRLLSPGSHALLGPGLAIALPGAVLGAVVALLTPLPVVVGLLICGFLLSQTIPMLSRHATEVERQIARVKRVTAEGISSSEAGLHRPSGVSQMVSSTVLGIGRASYILTARFLAVWARWVRAGREPEGFKCEIGMCSMLDDDPRLNCPQCHERHQFVKTWPSLEAPLVARCGDATCSHFAPTWRGVRQMEKRAWSREYAMCLGGCGKQQQLHRDILILGKPGEGVDLALAGIAQWSRQNLELDDRNRRLADQWAAGRKRQTGRLAKIAHRRIQTIEGKSHAGPVVAFTIEIEPGTRSPIWAGERHVVVAAPNTPHDEDRAYGEVAGRLALAMLNPADSRKRPKYPRRTRWQRATQHVRPSWHGVWPPPVIAGIGLPDIDIRLGQTQVKVIRSANDMCTLIDGLMS